MKGRLRFMAGCAVLTVLAGGLICGGCGKEVRVTEGETASVQADPEADSSPAPLKAYETDESMDEIITSKTYYLQTDADTALIPGLTLFDDGTFGFSYDVLNSYYAYGTYQLDGNRLTAVTGDGKYHYVFQADGGGYVFLQKESSDISHIDAGNGSHITDGSVFAPKE